MVNKKTQIENQEINDKIWSLWKEFSKKKKLPTDRVPILYPEFKRDGLLFIGLNPSFNTKKLAEFYYEIKLEECSEEKERIENKKRKKLKNEISLKKKELEKEIGEKLEWKKENLNKKNKKLIIKLEKKAIEKYSYYKKFGKISEYVNELPWQHIDLFFIRATKQEDLKQKISKNGKSTNNKEVELNDFALEQLRIVNEMIEIINPKVIIVVNALASKIILQESNIFKISKEEVFEKKGYDYLEINNKKIPILFSSMLTGQRALDNHSFRTLKWQIKRILKGKISTSHD